MATQGQQPSANVNNFTGNQKGSSNGPSNGATEKGYETYDQARQKTGEVIDQVQGKAGEVVDLIKEQATTQVSSQKDRIADGMENVALMIRMNGDQLRQSNQGGIAEYTDRAASRVEDISNFLRNREPGEIVREVENFARREPVLFLGGAFTLGLLAARFLKSSNPTQQTNQNTNTLARRQGYGASSATTAPLTPRPVTGQTGTSNYSASTAAQSKESTIARHFGEASAVGQNNTGPSSAQRQTSDISDIDVL